MRYKQWRNDASKLPASMAMRTEFAAWIMNSWIFFLVQAASPFTLLWFGVQIKLTHYNGNGNPFFNGKWHVENGNGHRSPRGPRLMPNNCQHLNPPYFSIPTTFKIIKNRTDGIFPFRKIFYFHFLRKFLVFLFLSALAIRDRCSSGRGGNALRLLSAEPAIPGDFLLLLRGQEFARLPGRGRTDAVCWYVRQNQYFGSVVILYGSGSSILGCIPIRIRFQGFDDQKLKKNLKQKNNFQNFVDQKLQFTYP